MCFTIVIVFQQFKTHFACHFLTLKSNKTIGAVNIFNIDDMIHLNASFELRRATSHCAIFLLYLSLCFVCVCVCDAFLSGYRISLSFLFRSLSDSTHWNQTETLFSRQTLIAMDTNSMQQSNRVEHSRNQMGIKWVPIYTNTHSPGSGGIEMVTVSKRHITTCYWTSLFNSLTHSHTIR